MTLENYINEKFAEFLNKNPEVRRLLEEKIEEVVNPNKKLKEEIQKFDDSIRSSNEDSSGVYVFSL